MDSRMIPHGVAPWYVGGRSARCLAGALLLLPGMTPGEATISPTMVPPWRRPAAGCCRPPGGSAAGIPARKIVLAKVTGDTG
jgi:hypothetical protein